MTPPVTPDVETSDLAPPAGRQVLGALALMFLTVGLATAMVGPLLALFLTDTVHADGPRVAVLMTAAPVASMVVSTAVGRLSDRLRSRQWLLVATALSGAAASAVTATVRDYWVLLVVALTLFAGSGALMSQVFAHAREALGGSGRVALTISSLRSLFSVAWVAGPPLATLLLHLGGFTLVYGASAAMYTIAALVALLALGRPRPAPPAAVTTVAAGTTVSVEAPVAVEAPRAMIRATVLAFVLTRCAGSLSVQALSLFTTRNLHSSVSVAGLLLGLCAALEIPLLLGLGALSTRVPVHRLLVGGMGCGLGYLVLASVATSPWLLVAGQLLNAASVAATAGVGITYVQDLMPRHAGRASTLYSNTFTMGAVLAGPVLGAAQTFGYRMPFLVGAVMNAVALVVLARTAPRVPRP